MAEPDSILRVAVFLDGRPGHEKQSLGIIQGLENRVKVQLTKISVQRVKFLYKIYQLARLIFPQAYSSVAKIENVDLLIGTGTSTHLPMLFCKKKYGIPVVTCMYPEPFLAPFIDLCFVPEHDGVRQKENIILTTGAPNTCINKNKHQQNRGVILLGGEDKTSHVWNSANILGKVQSIVSATPHVRWVISSSPRTPDMCVEATRLLSDRLENLEFFHYSDTPSGWVEQQYDTCSYAWVTADSISMISEALSAGCRVGLLTVPWKKGGKKFKRNEEFLCQKGLVTTYDDWLKGAVEKSADVGLNEAQRCADLIMERLLWKRRS